MLGVVKVKGGRLGNMAVDLGGVKGEGAFLELLLVLIILLLVMLGSKGIDLLCIGMGTAEY